MDRFLRAGDQRPLQRRHSFEIPQMIGIFDEPLNLAVADVNANVLIHDVQTLIQRPHKSDSEIFTSELWGRAWIMKQHNMQIYDAIAQFDPTVNHDGNDPYHNVSWVCLHNFLLLLLMYYTSWDSSLHTLESRLQSLRYPMTLYLQNLILKRRRLLIVLVLLVMQYFRRMQFLLVRTNHLCQPTWVEAHWNSEKDCLSSRKWH